MFGYAVSVAGVMVLDRIVPDKVFQIGHELEIKFTQINVCLVELGSDEQLYVFFGGIIVLHGTIGQYPLVDLGTIGHQLQQRVAMLNALLPQIGNLDSFSVNCISLVLKHPVLFSQQEPDIVNV